MVEMYEVALIIAGLLITIGTIGICYCLVTRQVTIVRRPLTVLAFLWGLLLEILYVNFLANFFWEIELLKGLAPRAIIVVIYLMLGMFLILKPYVNIKEYQQIKRVLHDVSESEKDSG